MTDRNTSRVFHRVGLTRRRVFRVIACCLQKSQEGFRAFCFRVDEDLRQTLRNNTEFQVLSAYLPLLTKEPLVG